MKVSPKTLATLHQSLAAALMMSASSAHGLPPDATALKVVCYKLVKDAEGKDVPDRSCDMTVLNTSRSTPLQPNGCAVNQSSETIAVTEIVEPCAGTEEPTQL